MNTHTTMTTVQPCGPNVLTALARHLLQKAVSLCPGMKDDTEPGDVSKYRHEYLIRFASHTERRIHNGGTAL